MIPTLKQWFSHRIRHASRVRLGILSPSGLFRITAKGWIGTRNVQYTSNGIYTNNSKIVYVM